MGRPSAGDGGRPHAQPRWRSRQRASIARWILLAILTIMTAVLGFIGFSKHFAATGERVTLSSLVYLTFGLVIQKSVDKWPVVPWELDVARFTAQFIAAWAAIEGLAALFRRQIDLLRSRFFKNHTVVCGSGRMGSLIAARFAERGERLILVDPDESTGATDGSAESAFVRLTADCTDPAALRRARVHRARTLVCCDEADGANAEIAIAAEQAVEGRTGDRLLVSIHITDTRLWTLLRERELASASSTTRHEYFNVFDAGARALLADDTAFTLAEPASPPRFIVIGMGRCGESLIAHASREWWYRHGGNAAKLSITAIDKCAHAKVGALENRYPGLSASSEVEALELDVESPQFERGDYLERQGPHRSTSVYVCFDDDQRSLSTALRVRTRAHGDDVRVVARMAGHTGLALLIAEEAATPTAGIEAFPLLERVCSPELVEGGTRERIARALHAVYVRGRLAAGDTPESNPSAIPWHRLPEAMRRSTRCQADDVARKLAAIGTCLVPLDDWTETPRALTPQEIETLARMEHERWCEERRADGWVHDPGPKDVEKKTSPYLVPWDQLDEPIREIDREMVGALPAILAEAGFRVVPATDGPCRDG